MNAISTRRVRIERGIYLQPNGKHAVCFMVGGKPRFRAVEGDLEAARAARANLIDTAKDGEVPVSPRLTFGTVADRWITRFEALVASGWSCPKWNKSGSNQRPPGCDVRGGGLEAQKALPF